MKKPILILLLITYFVFPGRSQDNLDSLLNTLHNRDLYVAPIIYGVSIVKQTVVNKDSARINRRYYIVSSLDEDINTLAEKYSKDILVAKLYTLLNDPDRDLYANALLYDLLENNNLVKLMFMKREEWINNERWANDMRHWKVYMEKKIYIY
jgi:hypothetical protein